MATKGVLCLVFKRFQIGYKNLRSGRCETECDFVILVHRYAILSNRFSIQRKNRWTHLLAIFANQCHESSIGNACKATSVIKVDHLFEFKA